MSSAPSTFTGFRTRSSPRVAIRVLHVGERVSLAIVMFVLAFSLWTVAPAVAIWGVPQLLVSDESLSSGSLLPLLQLLAATANIVLVGAALAGLNRVYCRVIGRQERPHLEAAWRRPIASCDEGKQPAGLLEIIAVSSFVTAAVVLGVWFFFFADCTAASCA